MTIQVHAIDHVQLPLPAGSLPRARAFYEGLLGLQEVRDPALDKPGTLRYRLGPQRLDLAEGVNAGSAPQAHLALAIEGVDKVAVQLRARGLPVDGPSELLQAAGGRPLQRIYIEDPFGNRLELIEGGHATLNHALRIHFAV